MSQKTEPTDAKSPYVAIGIAFVVDQVGKGARTVLRYPAAPVTEDVTDDLFFRLTPRQIAKLFRLKHSLCGQPMTLSVGGTVFCCCATLIEEDSTSIGGGGTATSDDATNTSESKEHLSLFSIIVALAPTQRTSSIAVSGWVQEGGKIDRPSNQSETRESQAVTRVQNTATSSFLAIRRVHLSLARLSRALEREERRCQYVSLQSSQFKRIRSDVQKKWKEQQRIMRSSTTSQASASSPVSIASKNTVTAGSERKGRHRRVGSFSQFELSNERSNTNARPVSSNTQAADDHLTPEQEQEILETILAAPPITSKEYPILIDRDHHGNMARELVQVYHALARNELDFPPSPYELLTGQGGIVYINGHFVVAMEALASTAASVDSTMANRSVPIRPYHTVLFPLASPAQLLDSLKGSGSAAPRRLQQFLMMASPQKSLKEIAMDSTLPLQAAVETAAYLVAQGACIISPVLGRTSRLACVSVERVHEHALAFSQTFGPAVNLLMLVGFLTDGGRSLGESIAALVSPLTTTIVQSSSSFTEADILWLRGCMLSSLEYWGSTFHLLSNGNAEIAYEAQPGTQNSVMRSGSPNHDPKEVEELEETVFQMTTWLRSRCVITHLVEFLVSVSSPRVGDNGGRSNNMTEEQRSQTEDSGEKKVDGNVSSRISFGDRISDDQIFQDLTDTDCLNGRKSLQACCWRIGIDSMRLRAFCYRDPRVRIIRRVEADGDDW